MLRNERVHLLNPHLLSAVLLVLLLGSGQTSQPAWAGFDEDHECGYCEDRGWIYCNKHSKEVIEMEKLATRCSELARCTKCGGTLKVNCLKCNKDVSAEIAKEREELAAWVEKMQAIDAQVKGKKTMHCESAHFILTYNLSRLR